jgi:hypothetical protein
MQIGRVTGQIQARFLNSRNLDEAAQSGHANKQDQIESGFLLSEDFLN